MLWAQNKGKQRAKGRGVSLPYLRLENIILTTENPLIFSGEKIKEHQNKKA